MDAIVYCTAESAPRVYSEGTLRLVSESGAPSIDGTGRLDMFHGGAWGSVCTEGFTPGSATVACKQMGFLSGEVPAGSRGCIFNEKDFCSSPPHVADLACTGHEDDIAACPFEGGDDVFCAASEAVILTCLGDGDASGQPAKLPPPHMA